MPNLNYKSRRNLSPITLGSAVGVQRSLDLPCESPLSVTFHACKSLLQFRSPHSASWRRLSIAGVLIALIAFGARSEGQELSPGKYALVIGINNYLPRITGIRELHFAAHDADEVTKLLAESGFKVAKLSSSATRRDILLHLASLSWEVGDEDIFVLFFAGHGIRNSRNGKTYWVPSLSDLHYLEVEGIRLDHLFDYVSEIKARKKLILLDHCYSGDIVETVPIPAAVGVMPVRAIGSRERRLSLQLQPRQAVPMEIAPSPATQARGIWVIAGARDFAYESDGLENGYFTYALAEALTSEAADEMGNKNHKLEVGELLPFLQQRVPSLLREHLNVPANGARVQEVVGIGSQLAVGNESGNWVLIHDLPQTRQLQLEQIQRYEEVVVQWSQLHMIDGKALEAVAEVFTNWIAEVNSSVTMPDSMIPMRAKIIEIMESTEPDSIRAMRLRSYFRSVEVS